MGNLHNKSKENKNKNDNTDEQLRFSQSLDDDEEEQDLQRALAASLGQRVSSGNGVNSAKTEERKESIEGIPSSAGCVGLANLGNTCFMNSIIQCLSNTSHFRVFFSSGQYKQDINKLNPLKTKGELANEFGKLISDIWSGNYKIIAPHSFKRTVSQYVPQFFDKKHQDSEKFLSFLLNGLHEALNLMTNKPSTQQIESQDERDEIIADLSWKMYLKQNKSKIVELFGAQQKTDIFCPDCNRHCIRFNPYIYLSVPIVGYAKKSIIIDVFHRNTHHPINKPIRHVFHINKYQTVRDLAKRVANIYNTKEQFVLFYENWNMKVAREYKRNLLLGMIPNREAVACYILKDWNDEVTPQDIKEKKISLQIAKLCHSQVLSQDNIPKPGPLFGMPFIINFLNIHSRREVHQVIYERLYQWIGADVLNKPPTIEKLKQIKKNKTETKDDDEYEYIKPSQQEMDKYETEWDKIFNAMPYKLRLMPYKHFRFSVNTEIPEEIGIDDIMFDKTVRTKDIDIIIEWNETAYDAIKGIVNKVVVDREYSQWKREKARNAANNYVETVTLYDCINDYIAPEIFENDEWFCTKHKKANRKLDIWSSPEILVIHLKRFQVLGIGEFGRGEKISTFVECPIRRLDLSQYVNKEKLWSSLISLINGYFLINYDKNKLIPTDIIQICVQYSSSDLTPIYDLYAVSSHSGSYDDGHYTSYVLNTETHRWYYFNDSSVRPAKESDVISSSSYILFYKKCSWTQLMEKNNQNDNDDNIIKCNKCKKPILTTDWTNNNVKQIYDEKWEHNTCRFGINP